MVNNSVSHSSQYFEIPCLQTTFVPGDVLITSTDGSPCNLCLYEHPVFTIEGQQGI